MQRGSQVLVLGSQFPVLGSRVSDLENVRVEGDVEDFEKRLATIYRLVINPLPSRSLRIMGLEADSRQVFEE